MSEGGFRTKFEPKLEQYSFSKEEKLHIYERLNSAEGLAKYLAAKYPGMKRFGIDGCESLVPLVDAASSRIVEILALTKYVLGWLIEED